MIPCKVAGKFSIRLVPNQDPNKVAKQVVDYLENEFAKLNSPNKIKVTVPNTGKPWMSDPNHITFTAGRRAMKHGIFL